jgi:hypothetical protein
MIELEATKAKKVTIPKRIKRFAVAYYTKGSGWENTTRLFTTPESALEDFLRYYEGDTSSWSPKFYTVYELSLEVPIIAANEE